MDVLPMLEQCSSCITDVCSVVKRSLKLRKVLLFIVFMVLFVDVLPMLEQCSSCITDVCSVVKRSLKLR